MSEGCAGSYPPPPHGGIFGLEKCRGGVGGGGDGGGGEGVEESATDPPVQLAIDHSSAVQIEEVPAAPRSTGSLRKIESSNSRSFTLAKPNSSIRKRVEIAKNLERSQRSCNSLINDPNLIYVELLASGVPPSAGWRHEIDQGSFGQKDVLVYPKRKVVEVASEDEVVPLVRRPLQTEPTSAEALPVQTIIYQFFTLTSTSIDG
ncbi:Uncharacterized protein Fot_11000 [Forsythia ovata]|uniref:Uncharacterized protein n=1 Tax=Forsythia ovata TaxID=205694 RepID=A0ABD1WM56_9LAMI